MNTPTGNEASVRMRIGSVGYLIASGDDYATDKEGVFERDTIALFRSLLNPDDVVLDVGANIGLTSLYFAQQSRTVYSFEPSPTSFKYLTRNVAESGAENIELINLGLGSSESEAEIHFSASDRSGAFIGLPDQHRHAGQQHESIKIVCGDEYLESRDINPIDFVKIDVEGFELEVIKGLTQTISSQQPIVVLELNHWCLNAFQRTSVPDFFDALREVFPLLYAVDKHEALDLTNPEAAYEAMYHHLVSGFRYGTIVGAFRPMQLDTFTRVYIDGDAKLELLATDLDTASTERDQAVAERDQFLAERDALFVERNHVLAERDQLVVDLTQLAAARDQLAVEIAELTESRSWRVTAPLRKTRP